MKRIYNQLIIFFCHQQKYQQYLRKLGIKIGNDCEIHKSVSFGSEPYLIEIGNHVRITRGCQFITHDGGVWVLRQKYENDNIDLINTIKIGDNVHIGINTILMPGVTIGNNVIIGCGAVVTKDIPDGEIWGGIPAKKIKTIEEYYDNHKCEFEYTKNMTENEKKEYLIKKYM
jgi:Acetyltransferase (isoleucine patch superfamily)